MKKPKEALFVTAIHPAINKQGGYEYSYAYIKKDKKGREKNRPDSRCWGWYSNLKVAIKDVEENLWDFSEDGFYTYAVIELVTEGIEPIMTKDVKWFKFDQKKERYVGCSKPAFSKHIVNWALG